MDFNTEQMSAEDHANKVFENKVNDIHGYLVESFTEADEFELIQLSQLIIQGDNAPLDKQSDYDRVVGKLVPKNSIANLFTGKIIHYSRAKLPLIEVYGNEVMW